MLKHHHASLSLVTLLLCSLLSLPCAVAGEGKIAIVKKDTVQQRLTLNTYDSPLEINGDMKDAIGGGFSLSTSVKGTVAGNADGVGNDEFVFLTANVYGYNSLYVYSLDSGVNPPTLTLFSSAYYVGTNTSFISVGNFNGDPAKEVLLVQRVSDGTYRLVIYKLPPKGAGSIGGLIASDSNIGMNIISISSYDVDADGKDEIIIVRKKSDGSHSLETFNAPTGVNGDLGSPISTFTHDNIGRNIIISGVTVGNFNQGQEPEVAIVRLESDNDYSLELYGLASLDIAQPPVASDTSIGKDVVGITSFNLAPGNQPPANQPPVAAIQANLTKGEAPFSVTFDGSASKDPDGSIVAYNWNFGDGSVTSGGLAQHTYSSPGIHQVVLSVTDNLGARGSTQVSIEVLAPGSNDTNLVANEKELIALINQERQKYNLAPLTVVNSLVEAARRHSNDMAAKNFMSHTGSDGSSPFQRMRDAGYYYRTAGENIAAGYSTPASVLNAWMNSSGHRANILNSSFCEIGVGYAYGAASTYRNYWTLDLGCR